MYNNQRFSRPKHSRSFGGNNNNRGRSYNNNRGGGGRAQKSFDPRQVISQINNTSTNNNAAEEAYVAKNNFSDFAIDERLKRNISARGYVTPTPIQDKTIPDILRGRDVVGTANTGTGKTAAFLIPLINKILINPRSRALIVAPTRELAVQIEKELRIFSGNLGISSVICIGGVSIRPQISKLNQRPNFVIGTPGRLLDLFNQRKINFANFESIVLDEVDRMLDMGFIHDVDKIISNLPAKRHALFFSATLDQKTKNVMSKFISNPIVVSVKSRDTAANVHQKIVETRGQDKSEMLCKILNDKAVQKSLIFVRTKRGADKLSRNLYKTGFKTTVMHGNKSQNQRQMSLEQFKRGRVNILIATDVASRGIDVRDITHVINFDLPETYEDYIHRIGRTGRSGKKGVALSFVG